MLGYDEPRENVVLLDPARGQVLRSTKQFDRDWGACERFTLLACPKEPETNVRKIEGPDLKAVPAGG